MCNNLRKLDTTAALLRRRRLVWYTQPSVLTTTSPLPTPNHSNLGGIYFNDILMGRFVISQNLENNAVVQTSHSL